MKRLIAGLTALLLTLASATAQPSPTLTATQLSLDQQNKISEIITDKSAEPLTHINFSVALNVEVPPDVALLRLPPEAEMVAPELQGYSYVAVEELVAIVDTNSRKIVSVMQRMRRQDDAGRER